MTNSETDARPFTRFGDISKGVRLRADGGFNCIVEDSVLAVELDERNELFVPCGAGRHYLDGQLDDDGRCVGFSLVSEEGV